MGVWTYDVGEGPVLARSFVVRALFEPAAVEGLEAIEQARIEQDRIEQARIEQARIEQARSAAGGEAAVSAWHGFVTDAETGDRLAWTRPQDIVDFIGRRLLEIGSVSDPHEEITGTGSGVDLRAVGLPHRVRGLAMTSPVMTEIVDRMLQVLGERLPEQAAPLPPNATLERVSEKAIGLGNHAGAEVADTLGQRTVRGGRLDARVRFQLWGATPEDVDTAMQTLHTTMLNDREALRQEGFLKLTAADTTLAGQEPSLPGWRKATSYDVLFEYSYIDGDDALGLIVNVPVTTDLESAPSPGREVETLTDEMARWDQEAAPPLEVGGPAGIARLSALAFVPGPPLGGTVTFARTSGNGPVTHHATLQAFLDATSGPDPAQTDADVTLAPVAALAALGSAGPDVELANPDADPPDADLPPHSYSGFDLHLTEPVLLGDDADRFTVSYDPPAGPSTGLDQTAVVYLRVNAP